jgi:MIP family channel proteins
MDLSKRFSAEFFGTFWLVFGGCGSAVFAASIVGENGINMGIAFVGVSLAFGLTVLTMAYAVGHISGGHFNPAVTLGLCAAGRCSGKDALPYIIAQLCGAIAAAAVLYVILTQSGKEIGSFASNGFDAHSPNGYSMISAFIVEAVLTFFFLMVIIGSTSPKAPKGFAPIAIGLCLTLIHLVSIPITNTSVNPARSISQAVFAGGEHLGQVWLFIVAPIIGAVFAGLVGRFLYSDSESA